ncbi:hypothetical protein VTK26DRAFT_6593 [Humicola hyalothermophila]
MFTFAASPFPSKYKISRRPRLHHTSFLLQHTVAAVQATVRLLASPILTIAQDIRALFALPFLHNIKMGGKVWSKAEEDIFWGELIPHSPKRLGEDIQRNKEQSWSWFAEQMVERMAPNQRRNYTSLCVFEHYFQNACLGRFSPHAGRLPLKYWRHEQELKRKREAELAADKAPASADKKPAPLEAPAEGDLSNASASNSEEASADEIPTPVETSAEGNSSNTSASNVKGTPASAETTTANCQLPLPSSYLVGSPPILHVAAPARYPDLTTPRAFMPPQYYLDRFLANHDRSTSVETEDDGLFVTQPSDPWIDSLASRGYGYYR